MVMRALRMGSVSMISLGRSVIMTMGVLAFMNACQ
jgi:hypothetical protein